MTISIKNKIYISFLLPVALFIVSGVYTIITLNKNRKLVSHVVTVTDPSLLALEEFENILVASKMHTTNWVFLRSGQQDKDALKQIHDNEYPQLKQRLNKLSPDWDNKLAIDSIIKIYAGFEQLIQVEKKIMTSLSRFEDYDDPVKKLEAERLIEDELLPRTSALTNTLAGIIATGQTVKWQKNKELEFYSMRLRSMIMVRALGMVLIGIFLSFYMTRVIIKPINEILSIINDLGKGIIRKIDHHANADEIGKMIVSVNNLSGKLQATANFAQAVGHRNFDYPFTPPGQEDTLGKAIIAMRDNIKSGDERLNDAQHIAGLGSWERNIKQNTVSWTDEMFRIFDIDPANFNSSYQTFLDMVHPDDLDHVKKIGQQYLIDYLPFTYECRVITRNKIEKFVRANGKVILDEQGEASSTLGIIQDITSQKLAAQKIEDANRELSILFNSIDEVFFSVDMVTGKVIQISDTCEKLYGYNAHDFGANYKLWLDIIHPDDKHIVEREDENMQRGEQINNQYRIIRKDNTIRWVETKITPTLGKKGTLVRVDGITRDITERKTAEQELERSFSILEATLESTADGILVVDSNNNIVNYNKKFETLWRIPQQLLIERNDKKAIAFILNQLENPEKYFSRINELYKNPGEISFDTLQFKDGRTFERYSQPQLINGICVGRVWNFRDITEKKKAELNVLERDAKLTIATQIAKLGYWELDVLRGLFTFNDQFYSIFKTNVEKIGAYSMTPERYSQLFVHPLDREMVAMEVANAINAPDSDLTRQLEHRIVYATGATGWVSVRFYLEKDKNGVTVKTFGVTQDITDHKKAETKLHNSEERYRQIVETAQEGIWIIDQNNAILFFNKKMREILGYSYEEMKGKDLFDFMDDEGKETARKEVENSKKRADGNYDVRYITKSGRGIWTNISTSSVFNDDGEYNGSLAMVTDITQRKRNEELLQKSEITLALKNKELEQKNKELEQFAYVASHDLQEPLRTTSSFVELLQRNYKGKLDAKADQYLTFISQSSDRMKILIKDLLDYSRIGNSRELVSVDCNIVLQQTLADINTAIMETGTKIEAGNLPVIDGYPTEIKQLFQNLVVNAIKFSKKDTPPQVKISAQRKNSFWEFAIKDNGIGIDDEHKDRIFVIFQRLHTRSEYEGSGIGLAHCKKIVELHGGKIWIDSIPGEGTTFYFIIPLKTNL